MSAACHQLHALLGTLPRWRVPFDLAGLPHNGLYVLYEQGETGHGGDRIVRIGTHTGADQLPKRLAQHFLTEHKDRSIFRKNIGRCLLQQAGDPFLAQWEADHTTAAAQAHYRAAPQWPVWVIRERQVEAAVSQYMQRAFSFVVVPMAAKERRLAWEARCIATVAQCQECGPSTTWLGHSSPQVKIRQRGLWQVQQLDKVPFTVAEVMALGQAISRAL